MGFIGVANAFDEHRGIPATDDGGNRVNGVASVANTVLKKWVAAICCIFGGLAILNATANIAADSLK